MFLSRAECNRSAAYLTRVPLFYVARTPTQPSKNTPRNTRAYLVHVIAYWSPLASGMVLCFALVNQATSAKPCYFSLVSCVNFILVFYFFATLHQARPGQEETWDNMKQYFIDCVRDNLHLIMCMSPLNPKFPIRARYNVIPTISSGCREQPPCLILRMTLLNLFCVIQRMCMIGIETSRTYFKARRYVSSATLFAEKRTRMLELPHNTGDSSCTRVAWVTTKYISWR